MERIQMNVEFVSMKRIYQKNKQGLSLCMSFALASIAGCNFSPSGGADPVNPGNNKQQTNSSSLISLGNSRFPSGWYSVGYQDPIGAISTLPGGNLPSVERYNICPTVESNHIEVVPQTLGNNAHSPIDNYYLGACESEAEQPNIMSFVQEGVTKYIEFGGLYGRGKDNATGELIAYNNPYTNTLNCNVAHGFTPYRIYGAWGKDWFIHACYRVISNLSQHFYKTKIYGGVVKRAQDCPAGTSAAKILGTVRLQANQTSDPDVFMCHGNLNLAGDTTPPLIPSGFASDGVTQNTISLSWNETQDSTANAATQVVSGVSHYKVSVNGQMLSAVITPPEYEVTGLAASTTYQLRVRAVDAAGNLGGYSTTLNITTSNNTPPPPTNPDLVTALNNGRTRYNNLGYPLHGELEADRIFHKVKAQNPIYVSALGNDANDGRTQATAVRTINKAFQRANALLADGVQIDGVLLRQGDTFDIGTDLDNCSRCKGLSQQNHFYFASYKPASQSGVPPRPIINIPAGQKGIKRVKNGEHDNFAFIGLQFRCAALGEPTVALEFHYQDNILISDSVFERCDEGIVIREAYNVQIETSKLFDAGTMHTTSKWPSRSQGIYVSATDGFLLNGSAVANNGKRYGFAQMPNGGHGGDVFSHNLYLSKTGKAVITNNYISDASSHGMQLRQGGYVENNVFFRNAMHLMVGRDPNDSDTSPIMANGTVTGNIMIDALDMNNNQSNWSNLCSSAPRDTINFGPANGNACGRGLALEFNKTQGYRVENNIFAHQRKSAPNAKYKVINVVFKDGAPVSTGLIVRNNKILNWDWPTDAFYNPFESMNTIRQSSTVPNYLMDQYLAQKIPTVANYNNFIVNMKNMRKGTIDARYMAPAIIEAFRQAYANQ